MKTWRCRRQEHEDTSPEPPGLERQRDPAWLLPDLALEENLLNLLRAMDEWGAGTRGFEAVKKKVAEHLYSFIH